ncbi:pathogenesis-related protein 1-like [Cicer arietinum]|uniref:Pathogenesis-related protein 1-like n=1 Tax=Cicer arietinum TaxID=3827 RepID=A0A1S2XDW5_CICAR|nr:pathogenesis-related protein 1-like [Cicer arietinum]
MTHQAPSIKNQSFLNMPKPTISFVLLPLISILISTSTQISHAQNSPQDYLKIHNKARSEVGVGPIYWASTVASYAQNYANQLKGNCKMVHSKGPYGENLAWSSGDLTATSAVTMWVGEKQYYDYNTNTCSNGYKCGHYTQVVWRDSIRLGCAKVKCNDGRSTIISCNYDPPGNYIGQRPFDFTPFEVPLSFKHGGFYDN